MVEPVSIAVLTGVALTEGIKFLYNQADAILKRRAESKRAAAGQPTATAREQPVETPPVVVGRLRPIEIDEAAADELAGELKALRHRLEDIAEGYETPRDGDPSVMAAVAALRDAIEDVIGQRITFRGEDRPATGSPTVTGRVTAKQIRGRAAGVDAGTVDSGTVTGTVDVDVVDTGADVAGVRVRRVTG